MFVERFFVYFIVFVLGFSELEFEDVMLIDDFFLIEVFKFQLLLVRRIFFLLWVRLKYDVQKYIVDKEIDEIRVIFWYYRQFIEVSQECYFKDEKFVVEIYLNFVDYFFGKWFNVFKLFRYILE